MVKTNEISLREHFAGFALQGMIARSENNDPDLLWQAVRAYEFADAMIEAETVSFIHYLKHGNTKRVMEMLIERRELATMVFDISPSEHFKEYDGETALIIATRAGRAISEEIIRLLLENGANPSIKGKKGESAVDIATSLAKYQNNSKAQKLFAMYTSKEDK